MIINGNNWADDAINSCPKYATGFTQLLAQGPYVISPEERYKYEERSEQIKIFQNTAINIFKEALFNNNNPIILHWLLNETPKSLGLNYHRRLKENYFSRPVFFRTDEAMPGKIVEIQCPGSLWGEFQLTYDYMTRLGYNNEELTPASLFAHQLEKYLNKKPIIHHLLDNASGPPGMRYFIEKTRPMVKYLNIDYGIRPKDCNFIRSHSFFGLCAHNDFRLRLNNIGDSLIFDLPPHVLFDQKASLVLPFWSLTREFFSDENRNLFAFTTPLLPDGIELPDNTHVTIEQFSKFPRTKRAYYLKYAGSDVALNWGSKAVFRLSNMSKSSCLKILQDCAAGYESGKIWLIQEEKIHNDEITFIDRDDNTKTEDLRTKFSAFYGPYGCLGILAMHRSHYKVHGQRDTILSCVQAKDSNITQLINYN